MNDVEVSVEPEQAFTGMLLPHFWFPLCYV